MIQYSTGLENFMLNYIENTAHETTNRPPEKHDKSDLRYQKLACWFMEETKVHRLKYRERQYVFDGTRYVEDHELADKVRRFLVDNKQNASNNIVGNVVPIIGALVYRDSGKYPSMPFYFGDDPAFPPPQNIIAFRNGLLDLERYFVGDCNLVPHTWKWASTVCLPHEFNPTAQCPLWENFLDEVFEGDKDRGLLLQEWFGYCLTHDTSQHKLMVKVGPPRAGKGTTDRILEALLGEENCAGFNLHSLADKFGLRKLVGKLVAFVGEVNLANSRDKYRILEALNSIVGEDKVDVEEKFAVEGQSQRLPTRFNISCNEMPNFVDPSGALSARLLILNYERSFEGKEDRGLTGRLLGEVSGINNWALQGYARLRRNGTFTIPTASKTLVNEFRRENSNAFAFLQDCLIVEKRLDPGNLNNVRFTDKPLSVRRSDLEKSYLDWCNGSSIEKRNEQWLYRNLKTILPKLETKRPRLPTGQETVYYGVGLAE